MSVHAESVSGERAVPLTDIVSALDIELSTGMIPDYPGALNGLQFSNRGAVRRVAVAVDASRQAISEATRLGADLLLVHHGLFWSGVQPVTGVLYEKYRALMDNDIAVYASHLPLDAHAAHGNNARLAHAIGLTPDAGFARYKSVDVGVQGSCDESTVELLERVRAFAAQYGGAVRTSIAVDGRRTRRWAMCTGSGASSETIAEAVAAGVDTMIVGEGPHHTTVGAIEHGLCIVYAGHYATETLGVQALGEFVSKAFGIPWSFLLLPTGS